MTTKIETAAQAYERNLETARELANRIADHLAELGDDRPAGLNWIDVDDMARIRSALRSASDQIFSEGVFAPEAE